MKTKTLHIDFETRSVVDLKIFGLDIYASHPDTDAWCMAFAFDDEIAGLWRMGEELPERVREHVKSGGLVVGHNVTFEHCIWNGIMVPRYGWPVLKLSQLDCTMARAYAMAFPGSLKQLAQALGLNQQKDMDGHKLMMKMAKPRGYDEAGRPIWWNAADLRERLERYCIADVYAEREADKLLVQLSDKERKLWLLDQRINRRGIMVDQPAVEATLLMIPRVKRKLDKAMKSATGGNVGAVSQAKALLAWCNEHGVIIESLRKHELSDWLEEPNLPPEVREALEIRSQGAKASVAKLEVMKNMGLIDGRIRGQFQYHGATTGRFAGRAVQLHNTPRPEDAWSDPKFQDRLISDIASGRIDEEFIEEWHGPFMRVVSSCVRGYLVAAKGKQFIGADLKNIEGVTLPWLAGEEWKLSAFRRNFFEGGPGIYEITAAGILGKEIADVSKEERQVWGKVSELSLGYQGGKGAYKSMAVNYGVTIDDDTAEKIKEGWRDKHPAIAGVKNDRGYRNGGYWADCEFACMEAIATPGLKTYAGAKGREVCFRFAGEHLWLRLPSGRVLCYPYPRIEEVMTPWGRPKELPTFMSIDGRLKSKTKGKWVRMSTYGGKLVENITQAVARDILVEGMFKVEAAGYPVVLHVHDEIVSEVDTGFGSQEEYEKLMAEVPFWAQGMPLAAEGFTGRRYRK